MARQPDPIESASFIVRLHREEAGAGAIWRGEVEHVRSGDRLALGDGRRLLSFIRRHTEPSVFGDLAPDLSAAPAGRKVEPAAEGVARR